MLFIVGTRVRLIHTGDVGVVTALLEDDMIAVRLEEDDSVIPVFRTALERYQRPEARAVKAKFVPGKKDKTPKPPPRSEVVTQYTILKPQGIQAAFDAIMNPEGVAERYVVYLINDTRHDVLFSATLLCKGSDTWRRDGKMNGTGAHPIGELLYSELSDSPELQLQFWRLTEKGTGPKISKRLRIKPKSFFKRLRTAPFLNRPVHLFPLVKSLDAPPPSNQKAEDLRTYTKRNQPAAPTTNLAPVHHEVLELAHFVPEIDLHIERLVDNPNVLDPVEILPIQLKHFEAYLHQALRLGVERVFIIHGIGAGKLRAAIHRRLKQHPFIREFKNEYHPRYGHGATEVVF